MKHAAIVLFAATVCSLVPVRPAEAQAGFIRWLERLSGPGPFVGGGVEVYALCYGVRKDQPVDPDASGDRAASWFFDANCGRAARDRRRVTIGAQWARLAGNNTLQYDASVPAALTDRVSATLFLATADVGVVRPLDVGASAGFIRFAGAPPGAFTRPAIEPLRLTWKPLAMRPVGRGPNGTIPADAAAALYRREWLQIRLVVTLLPGGFDAEDFGAIPGTFHSGTEVQSNVYVIVNLANLLGW
jgi:hypothetical protein